MQCGEPFSQGKSNYSLKVLTFPWIDLTKMNTLHEFAAKSAQCWRKLTVPFK